MVFNVKNIIKILGFLAFVLSVVFITSCSSDGGKLKTVRLNEVTRSIFYCPQYVALALGYFEQEGLNIELNSAEGSDKTMTALLANQADIGLLGTSSIISVVSQGKKDAPVAFAQLTQRDGSFLISRCSDFDWKDLKNKKIIAGRKGGVPEMVLEYILKNHGFKINEDVALLNNIQFNLMSVAFSRGTGDYVALFEPTASRLVHEKGYFIVKCLGEECKPMAYTCYCASGKYIKENPAVIQSFTNAIYKAQIWTQNHSPREIAEQIQKYFIDFNMDLLVQCIENYKKYDVWSVTPCISDESIDTIQKIMIEAGELSCPISYKDVVTDVYAKETINQIS